MREWRDVYSQLHTVATEQQWRLNAAEATYEQIHRSLLAGLLGNVGCKLEDEDGYLGARGIKFHRHPGTHLSKKPGRWLIVAELVETSRLFGRGLAQIDPAWLVDQGAHLLKRQIFEPHWEKKAGEVVAFERATLYGLVVYNHKRVNFGRFDPQQAREIFIRHALVAQDWDSRLPFLAHNRRLIAQIEQIEHKARRQDVLVDDELIYAFYDEHVPSDVFSGADLERWYRAASRQSPRLLELSREALMRHEAAGVTQSAYPKLVRAGGVDCAAEYLHNPGDARDGLTITVPLVALNQVSEERGEWLVPGMLSEKVLALLKSLPQKPRGRLVPLPEFAQNFVSQTPFAQGGLLDALLKAVRAATQLDVKRADFKLEMVPAHCFVNWRVVDEHGRQLGMSRQLPTLKAEWGAQARGAFQALAALRMNRPADAQACEPMEGTGADLDGRVQAPGAQAGRSKAAGQSKGTSQGESAPTADTTQQWTQQWTNWGFEALPELMEIRRGAVTLIGYPALMDRGTHVDIEVFDEPEVAARHHREGLRRLVMLQIREPLKHLERQLPELQKMAMAYLPLGSQDELKAQILELAVDRAFLMEPLPTDAASFQQRIAEGRPRLGLIAQEISRLVAAVLQEYQTALRKLKDARPPKDVAEDVQRQLQGLLGKRFVVQIPYAQLQHCSRYLKAVVMRLDKLRAEPARDAERMAQMRSLEQSFQRRQAELKGVRDARMEEFRWLLEELRVSLFAQELRTPQPVSVKRLDKVWAQIVSS